MNRNFTRLVTIALLSIASYALAVQPAVHSSLENPRLWRYGIDPYGSHAYYGDQLVEGGIASIAFKRAPRPSPEDNSWIELIYDLPSGDLSGITKIILIYQCSEPLLVKLSQADYGEDGDESYAHYQALVPAAAEWRRVELALNDFGRPAWTPKGSIDVGIKPKRINAIYLVPDLDDAAGGYATLKVKAIMLLP